MRRGQSFTSRGAVDYYETISVFIVVLASPTVSLSILTYFRDAKATQHK